MSDTVAIGTWMVLYPIFHLNPFKARNVSQRKRHIMKKCSKLSNYNTYIEKLVLKTYFNSMSCIFQWLNTFRMICALQSQTMYHLYLRNANFSRNQKIFIMFWRIESTVRLLPEIVLNRSVNFKSFIPQIFDWKGI